MFSVEQRCCHWQHHPCFENQLVVDRQVPDSKRPRRLNPTHLKIVDEMNRRTWIAGLPAANTRDPENLRWFAFAMPQNAPVEGSIPSRRWILPL